MPPTRARHAQLKSTRINTATDTVVKPNPGLMVNIVICGGTAGDITVRDSLDATGTIKALIASAGISQGQNYQIMGSYENGITITTAAATDIVVSFK